MSDSAKKYTIAVIPGDGIGKEVTPWAQKALEKAAEGVAEFDYEHFDLGAERYLRDGAILPEEEEEPVTIGSLAMPSYSAAQLASRVKKAGDAPDIVKDDITKVTLFDYSDIISGDVDDMEE